MNPVTFELSVSPAGQVTSGNGIVAAFVPAACDCPALVVAGAHPGHDPGLPLEQWAPPVVGHLFAALGQPGGLRWAVVDNWGRFFEAVPLWSLEFGAPPQLTLKRFPAGAGVDAFTKELGAAAEAGLEMLSAVVERAVPPTETPTAREFLEAIEVHGNLPAPGALFQKVNGAAVKGDIKEAARVIRPDPVISATLLNYANAASFAAARKTASVAEAIQRLGMTHVRRVVFVAEMMARYQKGICPGFDYQGYWHNAIATGAAMRGLMVEFGIAAQFADDAFMAGLLSGIGWLAVAETFPALMADYLARTRDADPITKARAQNELFPCPMRKVSETYLGRFEFPETIRHALMGTPTGDGRVWFDCLARAIRAAQALSPFDCLAVPTTVAVPDACREEWQAWQGMLSS